MASYTPNLDLLKKSPVTDGDDMFNVETMLNENWDRIDRGVGDYTAPAQKMGLTGDLSVGASLGVLADIGNVHVWRKTVVAEEEVPAGYKLVDDNTDRTLDDVPNALINLGNSNQRTAYINCADSITVDDGGGISLNSATTHYQANDALNAASWLRGKYIKLYYINDFGNWFGPPALDQNKTYYVPNDAQISVNSATIIVDKLQRVDAYPLTPAGTHITYLTSVNRNAYQEGDDAKEAGYVLGDMVSGYLFASAWTGNASNYYYSETIKVSDTGTLTQENVKSYTANATNDSWVSNIQSAIRGKFITVSGEKDNGGSEGTNLVYIPDDAIVSYFENGVSLGYPYNYGFLVSKMQQVTGYPAIPAGTTIDYLGVLGEKVSVETGSYTGTGTYGSSNLNTIHLSRTPKLVFITPYNGANRMMLFVFGGNSSFSGYSGSASLSYQQIVSDGTDFSWYANNADIQLNNSGTKYVYTAVI
ncbi:MAG: hypothetical protein ACLT25_10415 [Evtepia gabavorous]|uniref:hypothetical protein n=1 Tax=Evtepia gabavorous TaxID=2211183 RepID=UPI00206A9F58|nr:MAG TPA: hypothetical protein [Caudoviricetes sp.]